MYKIVGSTAAKRIFPEWHRVSDVDVWNDGSDIFQGIKGYDVCRMPTNILEAFESKTEYASLNDLYTIKISHMPWDIFWSKHLQHALVFKKHGAQINQKLYLFLQEHWNKQHGSKDFLSLYKTKSEFFDDAVVKMYDHDFLHELIAYPNVPIYTTVLKDGEQVAIDKNKFDALSFEQQIKMMREEIAVIACERWLLNPKNRGKMPISRAWSMALRKTTTALTKGSYSRLICENLEHFIHPSMNEINYLLERTIYGKES